jgi:muramoyltetrapeptide carboxypeptidase
MKPPILRAGDTIAIVAPSWSGPARFPHRVERGVTFLKSLGYRVILAPHAAGDRGHVSGTAEERAADLHWCFADPNVRAIVAAIGGDHSNQLLPLLDWDLIAANPTIVMGYSDVTVLNVAIYSMTGLTTFNGPALITDFGEFPEPFTYTVDSMQRVLGSTEPPGELKAATAWSDEFLDWGTKEDLKRPRALSSTGGWTWLKGGRASGRLVGGCLESLEHLRGTRYWPDLNGAILFLEISEEVPPPERVEAVLQDYENMGAFARIAGLLIGRPMGYTPAWRERLRDVLLSATSRYSFPMIADMDFGHTAPQITIPIGCIATIDAGRRRFSIDEAAVTINRPSREAETRESRIS